MTWTNPSPRTVARLDEDELAQRLGPWLASAR